MLINVERSLKYRLIIIMGGRDKFFDDPVQSDQDIGGGGYLGTTLYMD